MKKAFILKYVDWGTYTAGLGWKYWKVMVDTVGGSVQMLKG